MKGHLLNCYVNFLVLHGRGPELLPSFLQGLQQAHAAHACVRVCSTCSPLEFLGGLHFFVFGTPVPFAVFVFLLPMLHLQLGLRNAIVMLTIVCYGVCPELARAGLLVSFLGFFAQLFALAQFFVFEFLFCLERCVEDLALPCSSPCCLFLSSSFLRTF